MSTFKSKEQKLIFTKALTNIVKNIEIGDRLRLYNTNSDGALSVFDNCKPGCPDVSIVEEFVGLGGNCNSQVALKDKKGFFSKAKNSIRNILSLPADDIDIYRSLENIQAVAVNSNAQMSTYIFSTLIPNKIDTLDSESFNAEFVRVVQGNRIPELFPTATYAAVVANKNVIKYWEDLYKIRGQKFEFIAH